MAKLVQTLIAVLFLLAAAANRATSTFFMYKFYSKKLDGLILQGNADLCPDGSPLCLTDFQPNQVGRVLYSKPTQFGGQIYFHTYFNFIIERDTTPPGYGLAFFIAPVDSAIPDGSSGANLGIFGPDGAGSNVFAVVITSGPERPYIGINIGSATPAAKTYVDTTSVTGQPMGIEIIYDPYTTTIKAVMPYRADRFEVSYQHDLSAFLDQQVQVGLSAATGEYFSSHTIGSWTLICGPASPAGFQKSDM